MKRTDDEIYEQIDKAQKGMNIGSKWPGMSYEEGVRAALDWVLGDAEEAPMED
jgi:hypothetical protein